MYKVDHALLVVPIVLLSCPPLPLPFPPSLPLPLPPSPPPSPILITLLE